MAHTDVQPFWVVHQLQKAHHVVVVVQGLADAHEDDVGDGQSGVLLGKHHLIQDLRRLQPPHQAAQGGRAKGAAHPAAHLGGDADGVAVLVAHDHRLHAVAVRQTPQVLDGAVQLGHLLPLHLGHGQDAALPQLFPQCFGKVCHLVKGLHPPPQTLKDLLGAELGFPQLLEKLL